MRLRRRWGTSLRCLAGISVAVVILAAMLPSAALASTSSSQVVARTSGAEIVSQVLSQVEKIDIGSGGATVTVMVAGRAHDVRIDYGGATGGHSDPAQRSGLMQLAAFPFVAGAFLRLLRFLAEITRHSV